MSDYTLEPVLVVENLVLVFNYVHTSSSTLEIKFDIRNW